MDEAVLVALIKRLLEQDPVDVARLRDVAATHGLVNARLRARAWPKLLHADVYDARFTPTAFEVAARAVRRETLRRRAARTKRARAR